MNCYQQKGDELERERELLQEVIKILERVAEKLVRACVNINKMQFGFMCRRGMIDVIFIFHQLQEHYLTRNRTLYFSLIDLEKAFTRRQERSSSGP